MRQMTGADASYLYMETPTTPMHVVGVLVLDPVSGQVGTDDLIDALAQRLHLIPPFRRRAVAPLGAIDHPIWIEDPNFDLREHVSAAGLGPAVSWSELETFVGEVAGRPLRRDRPLWEMWIVEGLDDGKVALVTKIHHCIMDGGAGGDLMASLFDLEADATPAVPPIEAWIPDNIPSRPLHMLRSIRSFSTRMSREAPVALARGASGAVAGARTWLSQRAAGSETRLSAPRTLLNGPLSARRTVSLSSVDIDHVRTIRRTFGTTINDVVLAAAGTALRGYLEERAEIPKTSLVAAAPVNVRVNAPGSTELDNKVSNMMVGLPMWPEDPVERLAVVHEIAQSSKELHSAVGPDALGQMTGIAAPTVMTALARAYSRLQLTRFHRPVLNLVVSNIPGPPVDLYCLGAKVTGVFPMGPLVEGSGLNLTVLSEAKHLNVGIIACPDLIEDVDEIAARFGAAVDELYERALPEELEGSHSPGLEKGGS